MYVCDRLVGARATSACVQKVPVGMNYLAVSLLCLSTLDWLQACSVLLPVTGESRLIRHPPLCSATPPDSSFTCLRCRRSCIFLLVGKVNKKKLWSKGQQGQYVRQKDSSNESPFDVDVFFIVILQKDAAQMTEKSVPTEWKAVTSCFCCPGVGV